ncbi:MAG: hypothetical protein ABF876_02800 [Acetobacter aceti]|uniref:Uncharacterized protein n=1 Tax=Acetobacter aceti TaxID=435 RepID=A0A1U9KJJ1_ACEAC|nr:hypothetical protein [Acetobacter aceti]AQS85984.1 hypothetical protein A0U92_15845 [Acetobacter aceti]
MKNSVRSGLLSLLTVGFSVIMGFACAHAQTVSSPAESGELGSLIHSILARPLFEPDRHPKDVSHAEESGFHISGIVGKNQDWRAIFKPEKGDGKSRVVRIGDEVDGWSVTAITPAAVTLERSGEIKKVAPIFSIYTAQALSKNAAPALSEKEKIESVHVLSHKHVDPHLAW